MTREEAKKILKTPGRVIPDVTAGNDEESCRYNIENKMAIETAIMALEQGSEADVLDKIKAEILEYIDDLDIAQEICDVFDKYRTKKSEVSE